MFTKLGPLKYAFLECILFTSTWNLLNCASRSELVKCNANLKHKYRIERLRLPKTSQSSFAHKRYLGFIILDRKPKHRQKTYNYIQMSQQKIKIKLVKSLAIHGFIADWSQCNQALRTLRRKSHLNSSVSFLS